MKCERNPLPQFTVQPVHFLIGRFQRETRVEPLQAQMVLLVQQHPKPVLHQEGRAWPDLGTGLQPRQLLAHEMSLMKQLAVDPVQLVKPKRGGPLQRARLPGRRLHLAQDV